jgi:hypothetical protein
MQITLIADRSVFEAALAAAARPRARDARYAANAPLDGSIIGRVEEAWEAIRRALTHAYESGRDGARAAVEDAQAVVERIVASAGERGREVVAALRTRLQNYLSAFVDELLKQVRPSVTISDAQLQLSELHLSQKIALSGSLRASLTEAVELTSDGELEIQATYRK